MDRIREWISDNLRYILLGLAVILLIVIAFFAVRLIQGIGSKDEKPQQTERQTEDGTEAAPESTGDLSQTRNDQNILNLLTEYFTALQNKDMDTLRTLQDPFDSGDEQAAQDSAIEAYSNIITYSKPGLTEGS